MPRSPAATAHRPDAEPAAASAARPWLGALRALGAAALVIAALWVIAAFLLLPVAPV